MQPKTTRRLKSLAEFLILFVMVSLVGLSDVPARPAVGPEAAERLAVAAAATEVGKALGRPAEEMEPIARAAYEAGRGTKSLGPQGLAALRLLSAGYRESGLKPLAVNRKNPNHTVDKGLMQVNSVHFKPKGRSEWDAFCRERGFNPAKAVWNARANMLFAARIQEMQRGKWSYSWSGRDRQDQRVFYGRLVRGVSIRLAEMGIDWRTLKSFRRG